MEIFILLPIAGKLFLAIPSCTIPSDGLTRPHIVFSALRTLALSDMNRALAVVTFVLACGPVIINLVRVALSPSPHKSPRYALADEHHNITVGVHRDWHIWYQHTRHWVYRPVK